MPPKFDVLGIFYEIIKYDLQAEFLYTNISKRRVLSITCIYFVIINISNAFFMAEAGPMKITRSSTSIFVVPRGTTNWLSLIIAAIKHPFGISISRMRFPFTFAFLSTLTSKRLAAPIPNSKSCAKTGLSRIFSTIAAVAQGAFTTTTLFC